MPVKEVKRKGKLFGFQWGSHKIYPIWKYGKIKAKKLATKQGVAAYMSGWRERK